MAELRPNIRPAFLAAVAAFWPPFRLLPTLFLLSGSAHASEPSAGLSFTELPLQVATGSAEPNLAKGPDGTIVLSWLEPNGDKTRLRFSTLGESGWNAARTVAEGDNWFVNWADFPSVVPISDSLWAAHWLSKKPGGIYAYDVSVAISSDAGSSWSEAITPHRDNTATEHGFVSLFPWQDGIGLVWLDGRNTAAAGEDHANDGEHGADEHADEHAEEHAGGGMTLRSAVITASGDITAEAEMDTLVCDCCQTSVALARQGPVAVYRNRDESELRDIYVARAIDDIWQVGRVVHKDGWKISGCPVNGPAVAAAGDTVVVAWFTMADDISRVRFARSQDGGANFSQPLNIAEETPGGRVDVTLLDNGNAAISWLDETADGKGVLRIRILHPDGSYGPEHSITGLAAGRPTGFPQLVSHGNTLLAAWTDIRGKASTIRTARLADCNVQDLCPH